MRVGRATLPASKFDVRLVPIVREQKVVGTTRCGKPIGAPFDRADYDADAANGTFHLNGDVFGGQIKFDDLTISRQGAKVVRGDVLFSGLDLGALAELSPTLGESETRLEGKIGGKLSLRELRMKSPQPTDPGAAEQHRPHDGRLGDDGHRAQLDVGRGARSRRERPAPLPVRMRHDRMGCEIARFRRHAALPEISRAGAGP